MAKKIAKRIYRELTDAEWRSVKGARQQIEGELPELMKEGRLIFAAHEAARQVIAKLKAARNEKGISLAEVMRRSGISREMISRLENDKAPNPTVRTLVRYAAAVDVELTLSTQSPQAG